MNWSKLYPTKCHGKHGNIASNKKKLLKQCQKVIYEYILAFVWGGGPFFGKWWVVVDIASYSYFGLVVVGMFVGHHGGWSNQFADNYLLSLFYEI